jgi:hypothetical protein
MVSEDKSPAGHSSKALVALAEDVAAVEASAVQAPSSRLGTNDPPSNKS